MTLFREIDAYRTLQALRLTPSQRQRIVSIVREHVDALDALDRARAEQEAETTTSMRRLRDAVLSNQGVPDEVKRVAREAAKPFKIIETNIANHTPDRVARIWRDLSEYQRMLLVNPRAASRRRIGRRGRIGFRQDVFQEKPSRNAERRIARVLLTPQALRMMDPMGHAPAGSYEPNPDLISMITDVRVMNLVNSLHLSMEQIRSLVEVSRHAQKEYSAFQAQRQETARRTLANLEADRRSIQAGDLSGKDLRRRMARLDRERRSLRQKERKLDQAQLPRVKLLLSENQIDMIANFVPCTIPVQSLTNPERVGQADSASGFERALTRPRLIPESQLPRAIARMKQRVEKAYRRQKFRDEEVQKVLERIQQVVKDARALDDAEFEVRKSELARVIAIPERSRAEGEELERRIVDYLLSPNLIPIIEERLRIASSQIP